MSDQHQHLSDTAEFRIAAVEKNSEIAKKIKILDWALSTLNLFAIFVLTWWVIPALTQLSSENRNYHEARVRDQEKWQSDIIKWMDNSNKQVVKDLRDSYIASEMRALEQRSKTLGLMEEVSRLLRVDRKAEHERQDESHKETIRLINDIKALLEKPPGGKK